MLNSRCFGLCVGSMIIFNSILLGMEVNRNKPWLQEQFLTVLGEICNVFFLLELLLRLWCYRLLFFTGDEQGAPGLERDFLVERAEIDENRHASQALQRTLGRFRGPRQGGTSSTPSWCSLRR